MLKNRRFWFLISLVFIFVILFLTFQNRNNTEELSNNIRNLLNIIGINVSGKQLRSDAHIVEYCLLGIALNEYGSTSNKRKSWIISVGFCLGLVDELVRILLPTREFELIDLIKDWMGLVIGTILVSLFHGKN